MNVIQDTTVIYDFPSAPHNLTLQTTIITKTFKNNLPLLENIVLIQIQKCYLQICNGYSVAESSNF